MKEIKKAGFKFKESIEYCNKEEMISYTNRKINKANGEKKEE